jgi:hypothetical protein
MTRRLLSTGGLAVGVVFAILGVTLFGQGSQTALAQDPDGFITGIDMDPTGNTATSLSSITAPEDRCLAVSAGDTFDIDVWVDDMEDPPIPPGFAESILGSGYDLMGWPASGTDGVAPQISDCDHHLLLDAAPGSNLQIAAPCPDGDPAQPAPGPPNTSLYAASIADFGTAEYVSAGYTQGVIGRYTLDTTNANPGVYRLTLSNVMHGRDVPPGGQVPNQAIRDSDYCDLDGCYGLLAVDTPCPGSSAVGGIADYPFVDASSLATADSSGGSSSPPYGAIAGAAAAALVAIGGSGWYARRRWMR